MGWIAYVSFPGPDIVLKTELSGLFLYPEIQLVFLEPQETGCALLRSCRGEQCQLATLWMHWKK